MTFRVLLWLATATVVAACTANGTRVGDSGISDFYSPSLVGYVARGGTFPMAIHGNPFAVPQAQSDAAIRAARPVPAWAGGGTFVAAADPDRGLRLVLVFGPAEGAIGARRVCGSASGIATARSESQTHVFAAFCRDREWITFASIRVPPLAGPDDPALGILMGQVMLQVLPFVERRQMVQVP